ncbi:type VI secretion system membrane subunit TssM [Massilia forsythiae]|uniref:Type VI secretion system membrane subunit TssM n=1 Tax=Massilia forsythiae TaxID=2728020 RepID=A0A7Z2ZUS6_9BURK|nr:type VI secretion system membrane subunit TssM [Massilia forsythiae]QJE02863.1 type VI secretion system membrane subunit TssM [Massilia forsythiae]
MARLRQFFTDRRTLTAIGLAAFAALLYLGADTLEIAALWTLLAGLVLLAAWGAWWLVRASRRKRAAAQLSDAVVAAAQEGDGRSADGTNGDTAVLRKNMLEAIGTIKTSKLGLTRGAAALYELPWYMIIGNPAAGKSSAIKHSGLTFPIPGRKAVQGVGGTRNCDWFFTTDGILLDTAGRYAVYEADRTEWFNFLDLLRKHRPRAPVNGILVAVSVAELAGGAPGASIELAKSLRTRVQELTERLGVHAPVYVIFTKADLVAGFADFFHGSERGERERAWGATLRYNRRSTPQDVLGFFDQHFDELVDGLREMSLAGMGANRSAAMRPGVFTFPLEFASLRPQLRAFLATLFEENTWQFKPVFRGFYFTSALQEGTVENLSSRRVAGRFDLKLREQPHGQAEGQSFEQAGYFLLELFRNVIFADRDLVKRYTNPHAARMKYGVFFAATLVLGCALGGWSWSTMGNRQLVTGVQADLARVNKLQAGRNDLQSRLEGLEILQDRIEQLEKYRKERPLALSFGLYQGAALERKLRDEYFAGVREGMVLPVTGALEALLADMNANAAQLDPNAKAAPVARPGQPYQDASPTNVGDAYNALKTYLMLADKSHAEPGHLNDQLTRYWRGWLAQNRGAMTHEQTIRSAERLLTFVLAHLDDPAWPQVTPKLGLLDTARENLRRVVRGTPARERVYADIRTRAATRFPAVTVARIVGEQDQALLVGSYAVSGAFTRDAWEKFIQGAIREASSRELQSTDWVLKSVAKDDLTLEGSPEQIQRALVDLYKADYAKEWAKFVQGVTVADLNGFEGSVQAMNRLGDPQASPLAKLLRTVYEQTVWDDPAQARVVNEKVKRGLQGWFREVILRRAPSDARQLADAVGPLPLGGAPVAAGPVGREFAGVARLVGTREKDASLMTGYLDALSKLRSRLNALKNQGDPGPGAKQLMQQTLEGSGSELADALKYVDEQMLTGMSDSQKQMLRPLLVRPLTQTFAMIVLPSESEINKTWQAQVVEPFQKNLAAKYPFAPSAQIQATPAEIGQVFGPEGTVAKFVGTTMGPLVVRRGDVLSSRTWADLGITLAPQAVSGFPGWVAPLSANGVAASSGPQQVFQLLPLAASGVTEYTIEIDGQQLRYRNTPPAWVNMVHPGPQGTSGVKISAVAFDGRTVELFSEPGQFGLQRMIGAAEKKRLGPGVHELRWSAGGVAVAVNLKIVSDTNTSDGAGGGAAQASRGFNGLRLPEAIVGRAAPAAGAAASVAAGATAAAAAGSAPALARASQ